MIIPVINSRRGHEALGREGAAARRASAPARRSARALALAAGTTRVPAGRARGSGAALIIYLPAAGRGARDPVLSRGQATAASGGGWALGFLPALPLLGPGGPSPDALPSPPKRTRPARTPLALHRPDPRDPGTLLLASQATLLPPPTPCTSW